MSSNDPAKKPKTKLFNFLRRNSRSCASSPASSVRVKTPDAGHALDSRSLDTASDHASIPRIALASATNGDPSVVSILNGSPPDSPEKLRRVPKASSASDEESSPEYDLDDIILDDDPDQQDHSSSLAILDVNDGRDLLSFFRDLPADALHFPKYTRVSRKSVKSPKALNHLFLSQELRCTPRPDYDSEPSSDHDDLPPATYNSQEILVMEFSRDGKYLAVAGRDSNIYVWQVISSPLSRLKYKKYESSKRETSNGSRKNKIHLDAPVFLQEPVRVFEGHTKSVMCLDWSKNNFLVSGSMDKTVKLWNIDRSRCLETFTHEDYVSAVRFHPNDDRFFMSTALDNKIRLWSIMESCVAYSNHLGHDFLATTMTFTPSGETCILGGFNGMLIAVETQGCQIKASYDVMQKHRRGSRNRKIVGIQIYKDSTFHESSGDFAGLNMLMTTTDNRISLIDISKGKLVTRFKGSSGKSSSLKASVSEDQLLVICGSEDHWCYVWSNNNSIINNRLRVALKDLLRELKSSLNEKHKSLSRILHDNKLWNKVPVQKFLDGSDDQNYISNENSSYAAFHAHHSRVNIALFAPQNTKKLLKLSDDAIFDLIKRGIDISDSPDAQHDEEKQLQNGQIIVTCDPTGLIRVYRQDSAYYIRKNLIELKKMYSRQLANLRSNSVNLNIHNLKIDLASLNSKIIKTRSLSPAANDTPSLRSQFHHRLKSGLRNSISSLKRNSSSNPLQAAAYLQNKSLPVAERSSYFGAASRRPEGFIHSTDSSDAEYSLNENASPPRLVETRGRNRRGSSLVDSDYPNSILSPLVGTHFAMKSVDSLHSRG